MCKEVNRSGGYWGGNEGDAGDKQNDAYNIDEQHNTLNTLKGVNGVKGVNTFKRVKGDGEVKGNGEVKGV